MAKAYAALGNERGFIFFDDLAKTPGSMEENYGIGRCISCQRRKVIQMRLQQKGLVLFWFVYSGVISVMAIPFVTIIHSLAILHGIVLP